MIIKSMSRKGTAKHFRQLYNYISRRSEDGYDIFHNLNTNEKNREEIIRRFTENAKHITKSKRLNICYHEIISFKCEPNFTPAQREWLKEVARQVTKKYISLRAKDQLCYVGLHADKDHSIHAHLLISSNELNSKKRVRIPLKEFIENIKETEKYCLENYPEARQEKIYNRTYKQKLHDWEKAGKRQRDKERKASFDKTGKPKITKKQQLKDILKQIFENASTEKELTQALKSFNINLKKRGKNIIATREKDRGKLKCRLETIGLKTAHENCLEKINQYEKNKADIEKIHKYHKQVEKDMEKELGDDFEM